MIPEEEKVSKLERASRKFSFAFNERTTKDLMTRSPYTKPRFLDVSLVNARTHF